MQLINVLDTLKKYGIKMAQLQHIVDKDLIMLYDDYGTAQFKGSEFNRLRKQMISEEANDRTPTRGHYGWGSPPIDEMWQDRLRAERKAEQHYTFDRTIGGYLFDTTEFESAFREEFPEIYKAYASSPQDESYFISSREIHQNFPNIRESQLYEIIKMDITKIFDYRGENIEGHSAFEKLLSQGDYKDNPLQAIRDCVFFIRQKVPSVLAGVFPNLINSIALWEIAHKDLMDEDEQIAAMLAIEKFKGKSHMEAFEAVKKQFPELHQADPIGYVRKKKAIAQTIANRLLLPMPSWDTREQKTSS